MTSASASSRASQGHTICSARQRRKRRRRHWQQRSRERRSNEPCECALLQRPCSGRTDGDPSFGADSPTVWELGVVACGPHTTGPFRPGCVLHVSECHVKKCCLIEIPLSDVHRSRASRGSSCNAHNARAFHRRSASVAAVASHTARSARVRSATHATTRGDKIECRLCRPTRFSCSPSSASPVGS